YGSLVKGLGLLFSDGYSRYEKIRKTIDSQAVIPNSDYYRSVGLSMNQEAYLGPPAYERHQQAKNHMAEEKAALAEIAAIFKKANIPFWVDCGTCLGAYRYGGIIPWDHDIDISILEPDSDNARR